MSEDSKPGLVINAACASGFLAELKISRLPGSNMKKNTKTWRLITVSKTSTVAIVAQGTSWAAADTQAL